MQDSMSIINWLEIKGMRFMNDYYSEILVRVLDDLNRNISRLADKNASIDEKLSNIEKALQMREH